MLILLLPLAFLSIFCAVSTIKNLLWREKFLISFVIVSLTLTAITELLSLFHLLSSPSLAISWAVIILSSVIFSFKNSSKLELLPNLYQLKTAWIKSFSVKISIVTVTIIVTSTFVLALISAPNNIDAASFGLARVMHWIQNQSLDYFPTHITWQLYLAPFASFVFLHTILLSGTNYFTNLSQWIFALGSLVTATLIVAYFRGNIKTQILAAAIASTIPIGILQSSTSGDDYILTFFLAAFVYFSLAFIKDQRKIFLFISAVSLGLCLLTKQPAYLYALPFIFWFFAKHLFKYGLKKTTVYILATAAIALFINLGFFIRNYNFAGTPLFSLRNDYINRPVGYQSLISGPIKNISTHFTTPFPQINCAIYQAVSKIHRFVKIPLDTPNFNWLGREFEIFPISANENKAPNTIHFILLIFTAVFVLKSKNSNLKHYLLAVFGAFILFSAVLRWQPSASRFHLPLFVLWSIPIALTLSRLKPLIINFLLILLILSSFHFLTTNISKPVISPSPFFNLSRNRQYFIQKPQLYEPYTQIAKVIQQNHYKKVGLYLEELNWDNEYPLWVLIHQLSPSVQIQHVSVQNSTKTLSQNFTPDVVVFIKQDKNVIQKYLDLGIPVIGLTTTF